MLCDGRIYDCTIVENKRKNNNKPNNLFYLTLLSTVTEQLTQEVGYLRKGQPEKFICMNMHFVLQWHFFFFPVISELY